MICRSLFLPSLKKKTEKKESTVHCSCFKLPPSNLNFPLLLDPTAHVFPTTSTSPPPLTFTHPPTVKMDARAAWRRWHGHLAM